MSKAKKIEGFTTYSKLNKGDLFSIGWHDYRKLGVDRAWNLDTDMVEFIMGNEYIEESSVVEINEPIPKYVYAKSMFSDFWKSIKPKETLQGEDDRGEVHMLLGYRLPEIYPKICDTVKYW